MSKARANAWSRGSHDACKRFVGYLNGRLVGEASTSFCAPHPRRKRREGTRQRGRRARETGSARRASRPTAARQQHVYVLYINVCSTASQPVRARGARSTTEPLRSRDGFISLTTLTRGRAHDVNAWYTCLAGAGSSAFALYHRQVCVSRKYSLCVY